jgi:hypothetical protein
MYNALAGSGAEAAMKETELRDSAAAAEEAAVAAAAEAAAAAATAAAAAESWAAELERQLVVGTGECCSPLHGVPRAWRMLLGNA